MKSNIGKFAVFLLSNYMNKKTMRCKETSNEYCKKIGNMYAGIMKNLVNSWINSTGAVTKCYIARRSCYTVNILCKMWNPLEFKILASLTSELHSWVKKFLKKNNIRFPHVGVFIRVLFSYFLRRPEANRQVTDESLELAGKMIKKLVESNEESKGVLSL